MRITKWGEYAILFCIYLAKREKDMPPAGATEIGAAYNIPTQYAQQILHRLRKGGLIKSIRGPHGGFKLSKSPTETNLKEILYASEGTTFEVICDNARSKESCSRMGSSCSLKYVWRDLKNSVDLLLEQHTLDSLVEKQKDMAKGRETKLTNVSRRSSLEASENV